MKKIIMLLTVLLVIPLYGDFAFSDGINVDTSTEQSMYGGTQSITFNSNSPDETISMYLTNIQPNSVNPDMPYAPPIFFKEPPNKLHGLKKFSYEELDHNYKKLIKKIKKSKGEIQYTEKFTSIYFNQKDIIVVPIMPEGNNDVRLLTASYEPQPNSLPEEVARRLASLAKILTNTNRVYIEAEVEIFTNSKSTAGGVSPSGSFVDMVKTSLAAALTMQRSETGTRAMKINRIKVYAYNDGLVKTVSTPTNSINIKELIFFNSNGFDPENEAIKRNVDHLRNKISSLMDNDYKVQFLGVGVPGNSRFSKLMALESMREIGGSIPEYLDEILETNSFEYKGREANQNELQLITDRGASGFVVLRVIK